MGGERRKEFVTASHFHNVSVVVLCLFFVYSAFLLFLFTV